MPLGYSGVCFYFDMRSFITRVLVPLAECNGVSQFAKSRVGKEMYAHFVHLYAKIYISGIKHFSIGFSSQVRQDDVLLLFLNCAKFVEFGHSVCKREIMLF